jgi:hypothetical protein
MTPSVVAANPTLESEEVNTHMLEAWNALPDKDAWEANHEGMLETLKTVNEEFKDASGEEDKKARAQEYDVIGQTKILKKSLSLQAEFIESKVHGSGDQIVG